MLQDILFNRTHLTKHTESQTSAKTYLDLDSARKVYSYCKVFIAYLCSCLGDFPSLSIRFQITTVIKPQINIQNSFFLKATHMYTIMSENTYPGKFERQRGFC